MKHFLRTTSSVALCVAGISGNIYAQDDAFALEEIVVTAQKREQAVTDVSVSVTAFTGDTMREMRIGNPSDIGKIISNVDIKGTLGGVNPAITVRGVGLNDFNANNNPTVGIYVNDVFLASPAMLTGMMYDVQRVEVLKGPQGTLYGRNSNGGAINIHNRKPTQETEGYVTAGYGNYNALELEGAVGGGFSDTMAARVSAKYIKQGDSFHTNLLSGEDFGSMEQFGIRGQVAFENDALSWNLTVDYGEQDGTNSPFTTYNILDPNTLGTCSTVENGGFDNAACWDFFPAFVNFLYGADVMGPSNATDDDPFTHEYLLDTIDDYRVKNDYLSLNFNLSYDFSDTTTLTSITGYSKMDRVFGDNINSVPYLLSSIVHDEEIKQFSQELRLNGQWGDHYWILGGFYSKDEFASQNIFDSTDFLATVLEWDNDQETVVKALYASADWLVSDEVTFSTGLRYTNEKTTFSGGTTDVNPYDASCLLDVDCLPTGWGAVPFTRLDNAKLSDSVLSGRAALEYRPNDDMMVYASFSTGFKSGGFFGDFTFDMSELEPFERETIYAYEAGLKTTMADGRVQINTSLFYYDYQDFQTLVPGTLVTKFDNADKATIKGIDFELIARPAEGLDIRLGAGLLDTKLGEIGVMPEGGKAPNAADIQLNGLVRYETPVSNAMNIAIQSDFKYTDGVYRDAFNDPYNYTGGYTLVNGRISLISNESGWEFALWGKNLFNEKYEQQAFNFSESFGTGVINKLMGAPRTYGLSATLNF